MSGIDETQLKNFFIKWTPRALAATAGSYYGLGVAYEVGFMAFIDRIAISILKRYLGYGGVGALMPTLQWYASWGVRGCLGVGVGFLYDLAEKTTSAQIARFRGKSFLSPPISPSSLSPRVSICSNY